jgi:hypothetical protein
MRILSLGLSLSVPLAALACGGVTVVSSTGTTSGSSSGMGGATAASVSSSNTVTTSTTSTGSSTGGAGGAGGGSAGPPILFGGTTGESLMASPLSGVQVCVYQHPEIACVLSDPTGHFSFQVPGDAQIALTFTKTGFTGMVIPIVTTAGQNQTQWGVSLPLLSESHAFYAGFPGATYPDATKGFIEIQLSNPMNFQLGFPGLVASITPASGEGPLYAGLNGPYVADPTLQATSGVGFVRFANVNAGIVEVDIGPSSHSCTANFGGWSSPNANAARAPIVPGFETHVGFACF